ncbi:MAG: hypothetical protein ACI4TX_04250, partial [Christensenellales bacterium]
MNIILIAILFAEIIVFYEIVKRYIKQTEIMDLKSRKYFAPVLIINYVIYAICVFTRAETNSFLFNWNSTI